MHVTVVCFGALREYLPADAASNEVTIELSEGSTVGDLVKRLGAPGRLVYSALLGDARAGLEDDLYEGARLTLMPPFTGGRGED